MTTETPKMTIDEYHINVIKPTIDKLIVDIQSLAQLVQRNQESKTYKPSDEMLSKINFIGNPNQAKETVEKTMTPIVAQFMCDYLDASTVEILKSTLINATGEVNISEMMFLKGQLNRNTMMKNWLSSIASKKGNETLNKIG